MAERVIKPISWGDDSDATFIDARPIIQKDTSDEGPKDSYAPGSVSELPPDPSHPSYSDQGSPTGSGLPLVPENELKNSLPEEQDQPVSAVKVAKLPTPGTNSPRSS